MGKTDQHIFLSEDFEGDREFVLPGPGEVVSVPEEFVDGVHARQFMTSDQFPLRIRVHSTGQLLEVHGFHKGMAIYTSRFNEGGVYASIRGSYRGKFGEDFIYV